MNWRRVVLWLGLAVVIVGSVLLIARVSMMAFSKLERSERPRDESGGIPAAPADKETPARAR